MNTIKVFIPGEPAAKERPRSGKGGRIYTPAKTHKAEQALRQNWIAANMEQYGSVHTFEEPVRIKVRFYFAPLKSFPKWEMRLIRHGTTIPKHTKPDIDNLLKLVLDALNGVAYKDDSLVTAISGEKCYSDKGPGTEIEIYRVELPEKNRAVITQADVIEESRYF